MIEKKVDILMATYNGEKYLHQQLNSILGQTFSDFNLIIADDNSTDSTIDILLSYQKRDSRIHIIQNADNMGVIKNFEQLISLSKAPFFMLCDQDDVWFDHKIEQSLKAIEQSDALLAFSDLQLVDQNLNVIDHSFLNYQDIKVISDISWKTLFVQNIVTGCTIIANSKLKRYALPFPDHIPMHDAWLALVAAIYGDIVFMNDATLLYRQHHSNVIGGSNSYDRVSVSALNYRLFLHAREEKLNKNIQMLKDYSKVFNNVRVVKGLLEQGIHYLQQVTTIKRLGLGFSGISFKRLFPSMGIKRNIWWVLYLQYPLVSYMMIVLRKRLK